jgi:hypothetical protein
MRAGNFTGSHYLLSSDSGDLRFLESIKYEQLAGWRWWARKKRMEAGVCSFVLILIEVRASRGDYGNSGKRGFGHYSIQKN